MNSASHGLTALERAVLVTLAYTDQFDFPLSIEEIRERLLCLEIKELPSILQIQRTRTSLEKKQLVEGDEKYVVLCGRRELIARRQQRERFASQKEREVQHVVHFLQHIPWVDAVFLTGSQAMNSADEQSDLDFMIITAPNRVWLTRIAVGCYAQLHGKRRSWNREEPGSWCFNLWLDRDHLQVAKGKQDSYRAYEVFQAKLLWERGTVGQQFRKENAWVREFISSYQAPLIPLRATTKRSLLHLVVSLLDTLAWKIQERYMRRHKTTEVVGKGFAFFHPRDTKSLITSGWLNSLERCLPKQHATEILQPYV